MNNDGSRTAVFPTTPKVSHPSYCKEILRAPSLFENPTPSKKINALVNACTLASLPSHPIHYFRQRHNGLAGQVLRKQQKYRKRKKGYKEPYKQPLKIVWEMRHARIKVRYTLEFEIPCSEGALDFDVCCCLEHAGAALVAVATSFVSLHVTADAECLAAALVWALEWFLAGMAVAVNPETTGSRECLVAGLADVSILRLWE